MAAWCIGEFGHKIVGGAEGLTENDICSSIEEIIGLAETDELKMYGLTALIKLTIRLPASLPRLRDAIISQSNNISVEIQQRACEYLSILETKWDKYRKGVLETMPALKRDEDAAVEIGVIPVDSQPLAPVDTPAAVAEPAGAGNLLDIDLLLETPAPVAAPEVIGTAPTGPAPVVSTEQALFDIFSIGDPTQPALAEPVAAPPIMNLFSSEPEPSQDLEFEDFHGASSNLELTVYDDENFTVAFSCSKPDLDNP